jgi:hypothetical protein
MKTYLKFWGFVLFLLLSSASLEGQVMVNDTSGVVSIELTDGTRLQGRIIDSTDKELMLKTDGGLEIKVPKELVVKLENVYAPTGKKKVFRFDNPNATRYLFGPSAYNLKKGEGYYQNTYLIVNSVNYGLSPYFSMGGGIEFISTFSSLAEGKFEPVFFLTPKAGFQISDMAHAGGGIIYLSIPDEDDRIHAGITYGIFTWGSVDHNVTGGIGMGFSNEGVTDLPIFTLSGTTRLSDKAALVTENWFIPAGNFMEEDPCDATGYYSLFGYGVRFFGEKMSVDIALINSKDILEILIIGMPFVNFAVRF